MNDIENYMRARNKKKYLLNSPEGILDVIETDYASEYFLMLEDRTRITTMFSNEEWIDILTKSRNSYRYHVQRMNSTRKYLAQGI